MENQARENFIHNMKGALNDIMTKDLHFVFDNCTVSCHQSILVPKSPFLKSILASQVCGAGVLNTTIFLTGVKPDTMQRLVDYLYTGTCSVKKIKHVMEMIELKKILQLDINIEKRIYKRETVEALVRDTPLKALTSGQVPPLKLSHVKSEGHQQQLPYENKLRLKVENNGMNGSFFQRIVKSISGEEEEDVENRNEKVDESGTIDYESIRREMYDDVMNDKATTSNEKPNEDENEDHVSDDDDDGSSSSSSSSDDKSEDSDSEDEKKVDEEKVDVKKAVSEDEDDDDAFPALPVDNDDGVPSIPTAMLIQELDNDEQRLNSIISGFLASAESNQGDCTECGHSLHADNFVLHYGIHLEDIKSSKKKLEDGLEAEEQARREMEAEAEQELTEETSYQEPTPPPTPPSSQPTKTPEQTQSSAEADSVEHKIDKLQENQKRLSRDIVNFMAQFQRGAKTLECSECGESVVQNTSVAHFKSHINDLNRQIEVLVTSKKDNKRKLDRCSNDIPKKKLKEAPIRSKSQRHSSGDVESDSSKSRSRIGSEEERKKMYKRIYGRKKYQYRIKNLSENVTVSEEEIDAEIAKEKSKYTGLAGSGNVEDGDYNLTLSPSEMLRNYVQFGSKEYKHEFKKARDRLYKRKLRVLRTQGIMDNSAALDIPRSDIELEMLNRYNANTKMIKTESKEDQEDGAPALHEVKVKTENPVLEEDLELSLDNVDMGELFAEAQSMLGDATMTDLVINPPECGDQSILPDITNNDGLVNNFNEIVVNTTLDERAVES